MIKERLSFVNEWTVIIYFAIACIALIQMIKFSAILTKDTIDGSSVVTEINIITDGYIIYANDVEIIILSKGENIILFFNSDGEFLHSYSLSSYSNIDIYYNNNSQTFRGYYYRSKLNFSLNDVGIITFSAESRQSLTEQPSKCYLGEDNLVYCLKKNILGEVHIDVSDGNSIFLEINNVYHTYTLIVIIGFSALLILKSTYIFIKNKKNQ